MTKRNPGPPPVTITCTVCGVEGPFDSFPNDKQKRWGKRHQCRPCLNARRQVVDRPPPRTKAEKQALQRSWWLKYRKGLTVEQYDLLLAQQGGVCAVCGDPPPDGKNLHVDHDHDCCSDKTKRACGRCVRGLLCQWCNQGMGQFRDDPARLRLAAAYLDVLSREVVSMIPSGRC